MYKCNARKSIANFVMFSSRIQKKRERDGATKYREKESWKQVTSKHFLTVPTPRGFTWLCINSTETRFHYVFSFFILIYFVVMDRKRHRIIIFNR